MMAVDFLESVLIDFFFLVIHYSREYIYTPLHIYYAHFVPKADNLQLKNPNLLWLMQRSTP